MTETDHFINPGYGWLCKHCRAEQDESRLKDKSSDSGARARFHTEGEAEDKDPTLSTPALARWRDATHRVLYCPRCSIEESINKA